jgi:hypothetical protein
LPAGPGPAGDRVLARSWAIAHQKDTYDWKRDKGVPDDEGVEDVVGTATAWPDGVDDGEAIHGDEYCSQDAPPKAEQKATNVARACLDSGATGGALRRSHDPST